MKIEDRVEGDVLVLEVKERRADARNASALKDAIAERVARGHEWIVLDLAAVDLVDSSALGALVSALKLLGRKGDLVVSGANDRVAGVLRLTRMDKVFRVFPDAPAAVRALSGRQA